MVGRSTVYIMKGNLSVQGVEWLAGIDKNYSISTFILEYGAHGVHGCFGCFDLLPHHWLVMVQQTPLNPDLYPTALPMMHFADANGADERMLIGYEKAADEGFKGGWVNYC